MARFYVEDKLDNLNYLVELSKTVIAHLQALRIKLGADIELFNGDGFSYRANLVTLEKNKAIVRIIDQLDNKTHDTLNIHLAMALITNDKMDLVIKQATELGVSRITPIISERTQQTHSERMEKKLTRWQNIIISCCEQCGQNIIPTLTPINTFEYFINNHNANNSANVILSPRQCNIDKNISLKQHSNFTLLVGPEGGFSFTELAMAIKNSFVPLTMGNLVMRAETASIAGIISIYTKFSNWIH
ncbi:MAG: 16S rRNA (uracil(1498)-N(3))-methyltransferase [Burkholderiales bacterium]|nr:16S rRNA (uracil(1498)-N(3))-methyltransferase [Burkholderiales bacterium]